MKRIINLLLLSVSILPTLNAHLYKTYVWEATDKNVSGPQIIVEYSDHHFAQNPKNQVNNSQRKNVVAQAKELGAKVIVEDMFVPGQEAFTKNPLAYNPNMDQRQYYSEKSCNNIPDKYCAIFGMQLQCQYANVPVANVECRQPRIKSMEKGSEVSAKDAVKGTHAAIARAKKFNDGISYNEIYSEWLGDLEKNTLPNCEPLLEQLCDADYSINEMLPTMTYDRKIDSEFNFPSNVPVETKKNNAVILFDRSLVDINMLHEIAQTKKDQVAMVCAGGGHIERINEVLPKLGYKKVLEFPKRNYNPEVEPPAMDMEKTYARVQQALPTIKNAVNNEPSSITQAIDEQRVELSNNKMMWEFLLAIAAVIALAVIFFIRKQYKQ